MLPGLYRVRPFVFLVLLLITLITSLAMGAFAQAPPVPTGVSAAGTTGSVTVTWSASTGATSYNIYRSTTSGGEGTAAYATGITGLTYTNSSLANGSSFFYTVAAVSSGGTSAQSSEVTARPLAQITTLSAKTGNGQITIRFTGVTGATSYNLYRGTSSGGEGTTPYLTGTTTGEIIDTGVTNGQTYYYKITAVFGSNSESTQSSEINATPSSSLPLSPTNLTATAGNNQVALNWSSSFNATGYTVYRGTASGQTITSIGTTTNLTTYTDTTALNGHIYYYVVTATNASGESAYSNEASATLTGPPGAPIGLAAASISASQITLTWSSAPLANTISIWRSPDGSTNWTQIASVGSHTVTYTDSGLSANTAYYYYLQSIGTVGNSPPTSTVSATTWVAAPTGLTATSGLGQVSLTWNAVAGATGYNVKRATNAGTFTTLSSPTATSYTDTTGTNGTVYYYIVTATNTLGESAASNTVSATPYAAETGVQLQINAGGSAVSPYVADIDYSGGSTVSTGNSIDLSGVTNPAPLGVYQAWRQGSFSYTIPGLTVGAAYIVRLHFAEPTYSFGAQRVFSVAINSTTVLPNFDIVSAAGGLNKAVIEQFNTTANSSGQITIAFASVSGDVPLVNGIEVLSGAGVPSAPINLFANPGFTQAILTWNTVNGATSYKVYRATQSGGPYTSSFTASSNTYTNTGLTNGTTYYYVVTAVNAQGESVPSNQVQATPISSHASLYRINAGGFAVGSFAADTDFSGGSTLSSGNNIDLSAVTNPAPLAVYQTARTGAFTYTLPGLGVGATYTVRLHFADFNNSASGTRIFNVAINGTTVLSNFDIIAVAGSANKAVIEQFNTTANSSGQITIQLTAVSGSPPQVNGIEVLGGASAPSAPLQLTATAGNAQVALTWNAVNGATSYNIKRATVSGGPYTTISSPTSATYTDTSVTNGTTYYYVVTAVNASGESASSNEARAKPNTYNVGAIYRINCGGTTVGAFNADQYWSGTNTGAYSNGNNVDLTSATGPAPEAVYQSERQGYGFSYTFTGLAASTPYTVRLHFADITHQFPGQDVMSIVANGTTILSNLDVIAAAGGPNKALVEQSTVTSDASGNIALVFNNVTDYAFVNGIEILTGSSLPPAPSKLTATAGNAQVALSWTAVSGATSYNLKRATVSGGPYTTITSPTGTSYTDTGVTNGTTYYYVVTAVNTQGESLPSSEANATPQSANSAVYRINSGGTAVGLFSADQYFDNGGTAVTSNFIDTSMVANPAPQAVYQSFHRNSFTYTFSNLTPSGSYTVRLHFADLSSTAAGQNSTTVWINGTTVITSLDIYAAAGGANKALIEQLVANANASGVLTVSFLNGASGAGQINGIEILNGTMGPGNPVCVTAVPGNAQATITWNAVPNATSYTVRRATAAGGFYTTVGSPTTTTYTDTGLTNGTVYYYVVFAVNSYGQSATSNQASVVPAASGAVVQINAGGGAVSPFATDQDYDNAGSITTSNTVDTTAVALPAPQSVYQSAHQYGAGGFTYTIPGLTPSANYTVRLHFAEINYLYAGIRVFNVSINGTSVLSNFDIVGTAGSWNKAVVEQFNTSANSSGNIVVAFTPVTSLPIVNGIEIVGGSSRPIAPLGLTALLGSGGAQLTWQSVPGATGYNVYRTATSHTAYTKINTSTVTTTSYLDTGASATSPNYYVVTALNSVGESPQSAEAQTTPALTLSASGALVATVLGSSTNSILTASCSPGFAGGTVALTLSGVPTGVMAWLSPSSVTVSPPAGAAPSPNPPGIAKATLYLIATTGASSGTYTITVTATSGTYSVSVPVNLTIRSFDPTSLFRKGKSVTQNIGVVSQDTLSVPSIASEKGARK
jgi:fibronectin type 3 domain-containing protein